MTDHIGLGQKVTKATPQPNRVYESVLCRWWQGSIGIQPSQIVSPIGWPINHWVRNSELEICLVSRWSCAVSNLFTRKVTSGFGVPIVFGYALSAVAPRHYLPSFSEHPFSIAPTNLISIHFYIHSCASWAFEINLPKKRSQLLIYRRIPIIAIHGSL